MFNDSAKLDRVRASRWRTLWLCRLVGCLFLILSAPGSAESRVIAENSAYRVISADRGDSFESLAARYLGGEEHAWRIEQLNSSEPVTGVAGRAAANKRVLVLPASWANPAGVSDGRYPLVPILTYHRFGPRASELMVTPEDFRAQLNYLRENKYQVVTLRQFSMYLAGSAGLPPRAVVLTIDDGYQSTFKLALPILREFAMPATVFVYTDFLNRGGLKQEQMRLMLETGLIDIQSHSKTHANLSRRLGDEKESAYAERLVAETVLPKQRIEQLLDKQVYAFAYPYGATNTTVVNQLRRTGYDIALTVRRGTNSFFSHPLLLRRSMVFGGYDLEKFAALLRTEATY